MARAGEEVYARISLRLKSQKANFVGELMKKIVLKAMVIIDFVISISPAYTPSAIAPIGASLPPLF